MLKRQMSPLQGVILSLRHDDDARSSVAKTGSKLTSGRASAAALVPRSGFVSPEAKIYLADVQDHIGASCVGRSAAEELPADPIFAVQTPSSAP